VTVVVSSSLDVLFFSICAQSHCLCAGTAPATARHRTTGAQPTSSVNASPQRHTTPHIHQQQQSQPGQYGASSAPATTGTPPASVMPQAAFGTSKGNPVLAVLAALHHYTTYVSLPPMFILAFVLFLSVITLVEHWLAECTDTAQWGRFIAIIVVALPPLVLIIGALIHVEEWEKHTAELQRLVPCSTEEKPGTNPATAHPSTQAQPNAQFLFRALGGALTLIIILLLAMTVFGLVMTLPSRFWPTDCPCSWTVKLSRAPAMPL
jgi:hypothetical protein